MTARAAGRPRTTGKSRPRQTLIILGASGDLTARLLLPGLGGLLAGPRGVDLTLIGVGMDNWTQAQWLRRVKESFGADACRSERVKALLADTRYVEADVTAAEDLRQLLDSASGQVSIFFALPPAVTVKACTALTAIDLPRHVRLVLEKPFGTDAHAAKELNELLARLVPEQNVHRVDHFLGKSTVLNMLGFRFANRLFEPVLTSEHVERIDIVFDENLALEGRAGYYDRAGALVDMIQSHLLQVMAVLTMSPPPTLQAGDLRDRKAEILRATRVWNDDPIGSSRRGRYAAGAIGSRKIPGYTTEKGVDESRNTETLAEIALEICTWRWAGVPIVLRSGKALGDLRKEAIITFKPAPLVPKGFRGTASPEQLRIGFTPESMSLQINVNGPGNPLEIDPAEMTVDFGPGSLAPYGEVLAGVFDGDPSLSVRGDTAVDCWRIVQPVLDAWKADRVPLDSYRAGGAGPTKWKRALGS
ncbi:MAG: glucose-6-phosphate dehydrogenase [Nakamurella sp.]